MALDVVPPFAVLNLLPLAALAWFYLKDKEADHPAKELTLVIGMWAVLQGAAAAYARGAEGKPPGWRYMDSSSFILVANCFSIAILLSRSRDRTALKDSRSVPPELVGTRSTASPDWRRVRDAVERVPTILPIAFILWAVACAVGLTLLTTRAWQIDIPERHLYYRAQLQNARAFMATDDICTLDHKPKTRAPCSIPGRSACAARRLYGLKAGVKLFATPAFGKSCRLAPGSHWRSG